MRILDCKYLVKFLFLVFYNYCIFYSVECLVLLGSGHIQLYCVKILGLNIIKRIMTVRFSLSPYPYCKCIENVEC